jgi:hypothetical protein
MYSHKCSRFYMESDMTGCICVRARVYPKNAGAVARVISLAVALAVAFAIALAIFSAVALAVSSAVALAVPSADA